MSSLTFFLSECVSLLWHHLQLIYYSDSSYMYIMRVCDPIVHCLLHISSAWLDVLGGFPIFGPSWLYCTRPVQASSAWYQMMTKNVYESEVSSNQWPAWKVTITGEYLGRRTTCCLISPLFLAGFLCTALAPDIYLLYTGRILGGLALGLGSPPAGVLVSEVATAEWRTTFGGGLSAFYMVGMVITFILGKVKLSMSHCVSDLSMIMICWVSWIITWHSMRICVYPWESLISESCVTNPCCRQSAGVCWQVSAASSPPWAFSCCSSSLSPQPGWSPKVSPWSRDILGHLLIFGPVCLYCTSPVWARAASAQYWKMTENVSNILVGTFLCSCRQADWSRPGGHSSGSGALSVMWRRNSRDLLSPTLSLRHRNLKRRRTLKSRPKRNDKESQLWNSDFQAIQPNLVYSILIYPNLA